MYLFILPLIVIALLALPLIRVYRKSISGKPVKRAFVFNLCTFFAVCALCIVLPLGGFAFAEDPAVVSEAIAVAKAASAGWGYLAAALVTGLSCIGAGIAVAAAAPAAIGACSEDAKTFGKSIIFVALGESVALYGLLISIMILAKI